MATSLRAPATPGGSGHGVSPWSASLTGSGGTFGRGTVHGALNGGSSGAFASPRTSSSTAPVERALHARMEQFTARDSDRFRQLLRWIKTKTCLDDASAGEGTGAGAGTSGVSTIKRTQFRGVLEVLGVSSTAAQADALFDKYDGRSRGFLTLHELMCRASSALESDFVGAGETAAIQSELATGGHNEGSRSDDMWVNRGKRQFLRQKLTGEGERPITPAQTGRITVPIVVRALREKLRINAPVGTTLSVPRSRRELAKVFEYYDPRAVGVVSADQLMRALHSVGFPLGKPSQDLLLEAFPSAVPPMLMRDGAGTSGSIYSVARDHHNRPVAGASSTVGFDYISFILYVHPDGTQEGSAGTGGTNPLSTSLFLNHELGREFFDNLSIEERRKRGLPPTHEQYCLAQFEQDRENKALAAALAGGDYNRNEEKESTKPYTPTPRVQSQFARERAPPTPQVPLSPAEHYRSIAGRDPPASFFGTLKQNPYLQTVMTSGGAQFTQNGHSQVLQLPPAAVISSPPYQQQPPPTGSQTSRGYQQRELSMPSTPAPRTPRLGGSSTSRGRETPRSGGPTGATFVTNSNFLRPAHLGAGFGGPSAPSTPRALAYAQFGASAGADAFAGIMASSPSTTRRPTTGITTYTRGGTGRQLPPVTLGSGSRTHRG